MSLIVICCYYQKMTEERVVVVFIKINLIYWPVLYFMPIVSQNQYIGFVGTRYAACLVLDSLRVQI